SLPNHLFSTPTTNPAILDTFDRYPFTLDETPFPHQDPAITPAILGHLFEQHLPTTTRKKGGTFYTPRPIVDHLGQTSLFHYLNHYLSYQLPHPQLHNFVHDPSPTTTLPITPYAPQIDAALAQLTICDPAVGAGALVVGILSHIIRLRHALHQHTPIPVPMTPHQLTGHALTHTLHGVDINPAPLAITKTRLHLAYLATPGSSFHTLPNLDNHFICADALLSAPNELFPAEDESAPFNIIIANPPWLSLKGKHRPAHSQKLYRQLATRYQLNSYAPNLYELFLQQGLNWLQPHGLLAYIIPDRLAFNHHSHQLRHQLLTHTRLHHISYQWSFPGITANTMTLILQKETRPDYTFSIRHNSTHPPLTYQKSTIRNQPWRGYPTAAHRDLIHKIQVNTQPLHTIARHTSGFGGKSTQITLDCQHSSQIPVYKGASIDPFTIKHPYFFDFTPANITGRTTDTIKLGATPKILLRKTGFPLIAAYDDSGHYPEQSLYFIYHLGPQFDYHYLLGLLNSRLLSWYYRHQLITNPDSTPQLKGRDLGHLPIKAATPHQQQPIITLAHQLEQPITPTDRATLYHTLNQTIYTLYNLSPTDIDLISSSF
ncbi:MAG TPA: TaqI-like C-terminal specificity domain-containing protein, partial [Anaerolineae bacterium]|nr:TaqI-like C-terminal specificity domain-containing protein [Anaerolineae bacterium]